MAEWLGEDFFMAEPGELVRDGDLGEPRQATAPRLNTGAPQTALRPLANPELSPELGDIGLHERREPRSWLVPLVREE